MATTRTGSTLWADATGGTTANDYGTYYTVTSTDIATSSNALASNENTYKWSSPSNVGMSLKTKESEDGKIHPRLYFRYVKSKMNKLQRERLKIRLTNLQKLVVQVKELGQQALYEKLANELVKTVRQSEAEAHGIRYYVTKEAIVKFKDKVNTQTTIKLDELKDYDRVIPDKPARILKKFIKANVFDEYWILYIDHKIKTDIGGSSKKEEKLKTNKQKIKEKDPIVFGTYANDKNSFYYITDWVDEYCDLTMDLFLEKMRRDDPEYGLDNIPEMDQSLIESIVEEVTRKEKRLDDTNPGNYRKLMTEEDAENIKSMSPVRRWILLRRLQTRAILKDSKRWVIEKSKYIWNRIGKLPSIAHKNIIDIKDMIMSVFNTIKDKISSFFSKLFKKG